MDADVLIIGAGPSGSVAAQMLHNLGRKVVILEKEQFPRFSIGESLLPQCMEFLEQADLLGPVMAEGFRFKNRAAFSLAGKRMEFDFSEKFTAGWSPPFRFLDPGSTRSWPMPWPSAAPGRSMLLPTPARLCVHRFSSGGRYCI